jgi:CheY-like chemotaxis protein
MTDTAKHTVLIVEDNALVAKFLQLALERAGGFRCIVTEDVSTVLAEISSGHVSIVILDVSLTNAQWDGRLIDGVELAHLIRERAGEHGKHMPMMLATAHAMVGDRDKLLAASGADDYLEKPVYDANALVEKVKRLLREKQK